MDPNRALLKFLDACRDVDRLEFLDPEMDLSAERDAREAALEALQDLLGWIGRGGFMPHDPRQETEV